MSKNKFFKYHIEFLNTPDSQIEYLAQHFIDYASDLAFSVKGEAEFKQSEDNLHIRITFQSPKFFDADDEDEDTENNIFHNLIGKEQFFSNIFYQFLPEDGSEDDDFLGKFKAFFIDHDKNQWAVQFDKYCGLKKIKTVEEYKLALQMDGSELEFVPENLKNSELCMIAVQNHVSALKYVPQELRTPELCKLAAELCKLRVQENPFELEEISKEFRTPELCKLAVALNGLALEYVPIELRTPELIKSAVEISGGALQYVPEKLKTSELCKLAVQQNGFALYSVPEKLKTPELIKLANQSNA